jgi:multimeric flavodoxin WrbA
MDKKIIFIQGSPRKNGNTRAVTALAMEAACRAGAAVAEIDTTGLEFKVPGCLGCQKCQESLEFKCSIDDQLAKAVATLPDFDVIVISTPIYWWSYSAQTKIFIDRMYSLGKFREKQGIRTPLTGKALALIATGAGPLEDNLELLSQQLKNSADFLGCTFYSCLFPNTLVAAGKLTDAPEVAKKGKDFGRMLAAING